MFRLNNEEFNFDVDLSLLALSIEMWWVVLVTSEEPQLQRIPQAGGCAITIVVQTRGLCGIYRLHDVYSEPRTSRLCDVTSHSGALPTAAVHAGWVKIRRQSQ